MKKQSNNCSSFLFLSALLSMTFMACQREELTQPASAPDTANEMGMNPVTNASERSHAPAAHIAASEKLDLPAAIAVPANLPNGNTRVATYYAIGVQQYKAREKAGTFPIAYEWVFVAPQADLYDASNAKIGTHSAGPSWTLSVLDSIYGQQFAPPRTAPSPDAGSIDWLLLQPKAGTTPTGIFKDVVYIQRIATQGGKAPATPPAHANQTVAVKYKAVYRFTKKNQ